MRLCHIGLPVTDRQRSLRFYAAYFDFDRSTARWYDDGTAIVSDADGFDLALHLVGEPPTRPEVQHFGFRVDTAEQVRTSQQLMLADGYEVFDEYDDPDDIVSFKVLDPDGHAVEVYWEP